MIYSRDHLPMHVHVFYGGAEVIIKIETIAIRDNFGMKGKDVRKAQELVADHQEFLIAEWERSSPSP